MNRYYAEGLSGHAALSELQQQQHDYQHEVTDHFSETAELLNQLTNSYKDVHNHLAKGAATLCQGEGPVSLGRLESGRSSAEIPAHLADIQPPLDYAPKTSPDEKGMLNEEFGLDRQPLATESADPDKPEKA